MEELLSDIKICHIFPRLSMKSLLRCRVVSKQWRSLLGTPLFEKMHLRHGTNDDHQNHHKLLVLSTTKPFVFHTIHCEAPQDGLIASLPLPFEAEDMKVLTSFRGLVCVGINWDALNNGEYSALILWNPYTGDYKRLSKSYCHDRKRNYLKAFGLCYNSCEDDYKLLCIAFDFDADIYSLKTDAWRKIDSGEQLKSIGDGYWSPCTVVNEKLYFLYYSNQRFNNKPCSVIIFDIKTEKFSVIVTPVLGYRTATCLSHLGCLHLYVADMVNKSVELWRLDNDAVWKKLVTYSIHMITYPIHETTVGWRKPLHLMRDGNWLTHFKRWVYNIDLAGDTKNISCSFINCMDIPATGKYIETLVSPN